MYLCLTHVYRKVYWYNVCNAISGQKETRYNSLTIQITVKFNMLPFLAIPIL